MWRKTKDGKWYEFDSNAERLRARLLASGVPAPDVNDATLWEMDLARRVKEGRPYYDYARQKWMNVPE